MQVWLLGLCVLTLIGDLLAESQLRSDMTFWQQQLRRLNRKSMIESAEVVRQLKKNNNKNNDKSKNQDKKDKNQDKKNDKKNKEREKKEAKKCKKNKNCFPTAAPTPPPTITPPTLNITSRACGLYCDGRRADCLESDSCCDGDFVSCDASEFGHTGLFHCGKKDAYLGKCVEHDVVVHAVNGEREFLSLYDVI
jgi:hypothetical protein